MKEQLGAKYNELQDHIGQLKANMKRVSEDSKKAIVLNVRLKHTIKKK